MPSLAAGRAARHDQTICENPEAHDPRLAVVTAAVLDLECQRIELACGALEAQPMTGKREFVLGGIAGGSLLVSASS